MAAAEGTKHHVVCQVHVADEAHAEPVFRNEGQGNAFPPDFQRIFAKQLIPASVIFNIADGTGFCRLQAGDRLNELLLADGFEPPVNIFRQKDAKTLSAEEMYSVLYEKAERDESELTEEEKSSEEESDVTVLIPVQNKDRNRQAGDMQGAQDREIEDPGLARGAVGPS